MKITDNIKSFLNKKDIDLELTINKSLSNSKVDKLFNKIHSEVHTSIKSFYTENCNGFYLHWETNKYCGHLEFDSIQDIKEGYEEFQEYVEFIINDAYENCINPQYRDQANQLLKRMKNWTPLIYEGNGDSIILDLKTGEVLYNYHDWYDGFGTLTKTNGMFISNSIIDFLTQWGNYCFIEPTIFMDDQIREHKKVIFNDQHFNNEFKIENKLTIRCT